jgi:hypothetical protein
MATELSTSTFSVFLYYLAKLQCVLNYILPQSDSNCVDGFVVFIQVYANASAFVCLLSPNSSWVIYTGLRIKTITIGQKVVALTVENSA